MFETVLPEMNLSETANTQTYFENAEIWETPLLPYQVQVQKDILRILPADIASILDIGCGNGIITNILPETLRVVGVDLSQAALDHVRRETHVGSITALPFEDNAFDLVMANDLLEHLTPEQLDAGIQEMKRVSNRYILLTVPFLEDLNIGSTRCEECDRFYHVNHHRESFDLEKLQDLLVSRHVRCLKTVLSGDRWLGEPPEVILLKRLLGIDMVHDPAWVCAHCGTPHAVPDTLPQYPRLNQFLAQMTSDFLAQNPQLRDLCQAPTEVICLFEQSETPFPKDSTRKSPKLWSYTDTTGKAVKLEQIRLSSRYIDFRDPQRYKKGFLPLSGFLPYYFSAYDGPEGVHVSAEKSLLFSFFARPAASTKRPVTLRLKGWAPPDTVITLEAYDDVFSYHSPVEVTVSGRFAIKVQLPEATRSKYGMLFKMVASQEITLNRAKIFYVTGARLRAFDFSGEKAAFCRLPHRTALFLGLSPAARPHEMFHTSWMEYPSLLRLNQFPTLIHVEPAHLVQLLRQILSVLSGKLNNHYGFGKQLVAQLAVVRAAMDTRLNTDTLAAITPIFEKYLEAHYAQTVAQGRSLLAPAFEKWNPVKAFKNELADIRTPGYLRRRYQQLRRLVWIGSEEPFTSFQARLMSSCTPELFNYQLFSEESKNRRFLMICHDQEIDRRIVHQAQALMEAGWTGLIVCLSFDHEDEIKTYEGVPLHRIGKKRLIPVPCEAYWRYQKRQHKIQAWGRTPRLLHKLNLIQYKKDLKKTYRCRSIQYPLPFDLPFYKAGVCYPADLVIAHDLTALKAAHQLSRQWHVPLIYDSHELYSEQIVFSDYQKQIMDTTEREYAPDCAAVITVSPSIARAMGEKNSIPTPHVILNVTDPHANLPTTRSRLLHEMLAIPEEHKIVLYQGGIIPWRNLDILVSGFKLLNPPETHLVLLGPSKPDFLKMLQKCAGKMIDRKIHFLPPVAQQELLYYTTSADIGVIPYPPVDLNTRYCMPNKTFEYIQACLPILANDLVEIGQFVEALQGGGMVADLNSDEAMAEALKTMLRRDLEQDRQRLAMIKGRYTWQEEKKRYLEIVNQVMNAHLQP